MRGSFRMCKLWKTNGLILFLHLNIKGKIWIRLISHTINAFACLKRCLHVYCLFIYLFIYLIIYLFIYLLIFPSSTLMLNINIWLACKLTYTYTHAHTHTHIHEFQATLVTLSASQIQFPESFSRQTFDQTMLKCMIY